MTICERCAEEIEKPVDRLPEPWFVHDFHQARSLSGELIHFTEEEWRILAIIWRRGRDRIASHAALYQLLYEQNLNPPQPQTIRVHLSRVREKLRSAGVPFEIRSHYGAGYRVINKR